MGNKVLEFCSETRGLFFGSRTEPVPDHTGPIFYIYYSKSNRAYPLFVPEFGKTLAKLEFSRAPYLSKGLVGEINQTEDRKVCSARNDSIFAWPVGPECA